MQIGVGYRNVVEPGMRIMKIKPGQLLAWLYMNTVAVLRAQSVSRRNW